MSDNLKTPIRTIWVALMSLLIFAGNADNAIAQKRVALVIGNASYENAPELKNPLNDAKLMTETLKGAGFEVTSILDANYRQLKRAMLEFGDRLRDGPDAGLFYYAGHGIQLRGENYLIPVNARINDENDIDLEAIRVNDFLRTMNSSNSNINIVVLDACRNNPFARSFRSLSRGLAPVDAPKGTYVAYATSPGDVAQDGKGKNSPYTLALTAAIKKPGFTIEKVFKNARSSVLAETKSTQVPWETSSITGDFYFHAPEKTLAVQPKKIPLIADTPAATQDLGITRKKDDAEKFYNLVRDSNSIGVLETFAKKFPDSFYAALAKARAVELRALQKVKNTLAQKNSEQSAANKRLARLNDADRKWGSLKNSNNRQALSDFAREYAGTAFANLALAREKELKRVDDFRSYPRLSGEALNRELQYQLNRIGCNAGTVDGKWGAGSQNAVDRYKQYTKNLIASLEPTNALLEKLKDERAGLCPLSCDIGFVARGNRCVPVSPQEQILSDACRKSFKKYQTKGPISAFAITGNGRACGSAWNFGTQKLARERAIFECSKQGKGCHVIAQTKRAEFPISDSCKKGYKTYKGKGGYKAFALSGSGQACGWSFNYKTRREAKARAMAECRKNRKGCHVISVSR